MADRDKTREELLKEIGDLRTRLSKLEEDKERRSDNDYPTIRKDFFIDGDPLGIWPLEKLMHFARFSIETSADEVFWMNADSKIIYINDSACKRLGYTHYEMLRMHVWDWDPIFSRELWQEFWKELQEKRTLVIESKHRTKSGDVFPVEITSRVFEYAGQQYLFAFVKDMTERKQLESRLLHKNSEFEAIFSSITDAIVFVDTGRHIIMVNPAFTKTLGYTEDEVIGRSTQFLYEEPEEYYRQGERQKKHKAIRDSPIYKTQYRRKDNSIFLSETLGVPVIGSRGEVIGYIAIIRDITARVAAEQKIIEHKVKLETALESMTDGVIITDASGVLVELNHAWASFCRFQDKEQCLRDLEKYFDLFDLYQDERGPVPFGEWPEARARRGEYGTNSEYTIYRKDTGDTWVGSFSFSPILDNHGAVVGTVLVARDVTEMKSRERAQREMEKRLRQGQKMEAIGTLAGGIAHDFNNILSVIFGYAEIAKKDVLPSGSSAKYLDQILYAAGRAKDLVKQILAFSYQSQVEVSPLQICPLIKEGLKMLRSSLPTTIEIQQDIAPDCGIILGDPTQVHQVLMNLCTNAFHAMEQTGGSLSVSLHSTVIKPEQAEKLAILPGEYAELVVADTGSGIGPDVLDKVFDPYFTTKEVGKGTGMGLAIIHGIMKNYEGTITVESELGAGSSFHAYFPVYKEEFPQNSQISGEHPTGTERILFVDDEKSLSEVGKELLEQLGYSVHATTSSIDALEIFADNPGGFDLVITDQTMPGLTGADLARSMLQIRPDIPIILCTGYSNLINEATARSIGIKEFTVKPLTQSMIASLIRKVLDAG